MTYTNEQTAELLYLGYLGRAAEPAGLDFWAGMLASGTPAFNIGSGFITSDEAHSLYPLDAGGNIADPVAFVSAVYQNLFGRAPEAAGSAFWIDQIANGDGAAKIILGIINGAQGDDAATLLNKADVARAYTAAADGSGHYNDAFAHTITDGVSASPASVAFAQDQINAEAYPVTVIHEPGEPYPVPTEPTHNVLHFNDATIDISGTKNFDGQSFNFGAGNYATHQVIAVDTHTGVELALGANFRTGNQIVGVDDGHGNIVFNGLSGHQIGGVENMQGDRLDRSAVSFDFSINKGVGVLNDGEQTFHLLIDTDPTAGKNFVDVELRAISSGVTVGFAGGVPVISDDDGSNPHLSQNSVNFGFGFLSAVGANAAAGDYDVILQERDASGAHVLAQVGIVLSLHDALVA